MVFDTIHAKWSGSTIRIRTRYDNALEYDFTLPELIFDILMAKWYAVSKCIIEDMGLSS